MPLNGYRNDGYKLLAIEWKGLHQWTLLCPILTDQPKRSKSEQIRWCGKADKCYRLPISSIFFFCSIRIELPSSDSSRWCGSLSSCRLRLCAGIAIRSCFPHRFFVTDIFSPRQQYFAPPPPAPAPSYFGCFSLLFHSSLSVFICVWLCWFTSTVAVFYFLHLACLPPFLISDSRPAVLLFLFLLFI